ncbi:MAG TPA: S8 family peptidase [Candidatus Polarisedimenticolia bacterium]|nr:S8 family peptidase [Candidatus Polarisedimenticolia bacterium]
MRRPSRPGCARHAAAALLVSLALAAGAASPAAPKLPTSAPRDSRGPQYVEGEILVKFRREALAASRGVVRGEVAGALQRRFASGAELWRLGAGVTVPEALVRLENAPDVEYAEPNYLLYATRTPDDPLFQQQYALLNTGQAGGSAGSDIDATGAWDVSIGGALVVVAIMDSGIDLDHPDLAPNLWTNPDEIAGNLVDDDGNGLVDDVHGWDFVNHDDEPRDDNGHGTHVAGIVAAAGDNGLGIAGVAWRASLMPVKFLDATGAGDTAGAIQAIDYAARMGARIINASWGGGGFSMAMLESIRDAGLHEVLFVAAAGNDGHDSDIVPAFPAGFDTPNVIAVAATDRHDRLAPFSNHGATTVDIAAPGVQIMSALPGGFYGQSSGTSMATPHVSGVAALILGFAPGMGAGPLRRRILEHAEPVAALAGLVAVGGRVNALRCLLDADTTPPGPIADLRVVEPLSDGVVLAWTDTGDDSGGGAAATYDLKVSEEPFDVAGFEGAPRFPVPGPPLPAGSSQTQEVFGLQPARTYYLGLRAVDEWGNAGPPGFATASTLPPPALEATPDSSSAALRSGHTATSLLTLRNSSEGTLDWSLGRPNLRPTPARAATGLERWGGADGFGYVFIDSDEPGGPVFAWRDIGATGHSALIGADDRMSESIPLGFAFPFYGQTFTSVRIADNGFLSFTHADSPFENQPLPNPGAPKNLVAGYWDDLFVWGLQDVVWLAEPGAFTVQYNAVLRYGGGGPYTFQMVLFDSGEILFQYLEMVEQMDSATIGIQDASGTAGLPIGFNAPYVHDRLAVRLLIQKDWVSAAPRSGRLRSGESASIPLTFDASGLAAGDYEGRVPILSNDPDRPRIEHPVFLSVEDARAIAAEPAAIDFGNVFTKDGARHVVEIVSSGSRPLTVTAAVPDDPAVLADFAPFLLAPGERRLLVLDWFPAAPGDLQAGLRIESDAENAPSLVVPLAGIALNPPRAAAIWPPAQVECAGPEGSEVVLDGSRSESADSRPGRTIEIVLYEWIENLGAADEALLGTGRRITATLPPGTHRLGLRVTDSLGETDSIESTITVADTIPPELRVAASPAILKPPNNRMVPVHVTWSAVDACSGVVPVRLIEVLSSEPDDMSDGGDIAGIEPGTADDTLLLRAERDAGAPRRLYTLRYVATDAAGLSTQGEAVVTVTGGHKRTARR